jgi:hypothetical protein
VIRYYAAQACIRYYGPTAENVRIEAGHVYATVGQPVDGTPRWKAPHEYLASLDLADWQADRVIRFTMRFGPLAPRHDTSRKPLRKIESSADRGSFEPGDLIWVDTGQFVSLQRLLREAWRGDHGALDEVATALPADLDLEARPEGLELIARDLWTLIRLLFLRDYASGKVKLCANPDCETPYFLVARRGQKYCSHGCAVLINVRRFRERDAEQRTKKSKKKDERR